MAARSATTRSSAEAGAGVIAAITSDPAAKPCRGEVVPPPRNAMPSRNVLVKSDSSVGVDADLALHRERPRRSRHQPGRRRRRGPGRAVGVRLEVQVRPGDFAASCWIRRLHAAARGRAADHGNDSRKKPKRWVRWVANRRTSRCRSCRRLLRGRPRADRGCGSRRRSGSTPSAVTIVSERSRSQVSPVRRLSTPRPPPRVSPAAPTVGQVPVGIDRPCAGQRACTGVERAPAPTMASPEPAS